MDLPALGTITSYSLGDNVGRIRLDDGTELRVGGSALRGVMPQAGTRVRVTKVQPHPLGGMRAVEVAPGDSNASAEQQARAIDDYLASQASGPAFDASSMDWVKPPPLTPEQRADYEQHAGRLDAELRAADARADETRRVADVARKVRAEQGPAAAWVHVLREAGVEPKTAMAAQALGRPSAGILLGEGTASTNVCSRTGGDPDVPGDFRWPTFEGAALAFLAQIRLRELPAAVHADLHLPPDGVLSFFYEIVEQPWGYEPAHRGGARVFYFDRVDALVQTSCPHPLEDGALPERTMGFVEELSLPSLEAPAGATLTLDDERAEAYAAALEADRQARASGSKVGGYADEIQNPMELQCAGVTRGTSFGDGKAAISDAMRADAPKWRLLLQLGSDEEGGMTFGDIGNLYFWLHEDNLRQRAFEHAWCILQCT
jgi:uncharacterized protein YwqG